MLNCIRESLACSRPTYPSTRKRLTAHSSWRIERSLHFHILDPFKIILNQIQEIDPMKNLKNVNEHTCSLSLPPPNFWDCTRRGVEQSDRLVMLSLNRDTEMQEPAEGAHQMKKLKRTKHSCQSQMVCIYPSEPSCKTVERKMPRPLTTYLSMGGQIGRTVDQPAASPKWSLPANLLD